MDDLKRQAVTAKRLQGCLDDAVKSRAMRLGGGSLLIRRGRFATPAEWQARREGHDNRLKRIDHWLRTLGRRLPELAVGERRCAATLASSCLVRLPAPQTSNRAVRPSHGVLGSCGEPVWDGGQSASNGEVCRRPSSPFGVVCFDSLACPAGGSDGKQRLQHIH